jgi:hypothetical protein
MSGDRHQRELVRLRRKRKVCQRGVSGVVEGTDPFAVRELRLGERLPEMLGAPVYAEPRSCLRRVGPKRSAHLVDRPRVTVIGSLCKKAQREKEAGL